MYHGIAIEVSRCSPIGGIIVFILSCKAIEPTTRFIPSLTRIKTSFICHLSIIILVAYIRIPFIVSILNDIYTRTKTIIPFVF